MNKKLGKDARLRLDGQRAAQFTELLAGEKQANAAILTLGREAFIKDGIKYSPAGCPVRHR
ncbi:Uncharacterised protein [Raoultella ornithinolytica]|nr:Uncharacterised protein [Raoultella ornithinolytica]